MPPEPCVRCGMEVPADDLDADGFCVGCWDEICEEEEDEGNG